MAFHSYAELRDAYAAGSLHPMDLKKAVGREVNAMLDPVRTHFEKNEKARALKEKVDSYKVTR